MAKKELLNNDALTLRVNAEPVLDAAEQALDAIEDKLDVIENSVERVVTVTKNNPIVLLGVFIIGASLGGFVAYRLAEKRLSEKFDDELTEQIAAAKAYRSRIAKEGEFESPASAVQALVPEEVVQAVQSYQGRDRPVPYNNPDTIIDLKPPVEVVVEEVAVTQNVFVEAAKSREPDLRDWDYNAEIADRELNPEVPYTISFEEFNDNSVNHEQETFTYYAMDDTLADSQEKPIDNTEYTVGDDNLTRFGDGSGDPNVVYVRNEKISMDFEIIRSNGSYQREVLGTDPEPSLKHSRRQGRQRWRTDE